MWGYNDVFRQVPGVPPAIVGFVGHIRPADGRSEGDRVGREESDLLSLSVTAVLSVAFGGLFLDQYRYQAAGLSCVSTFGPDWFQVVLPLFMEDQ